MSADAGLSAPADKYNTQRWTLFLIWSLFIIWSMDIARPSESPFIGSIGKVFVKIGFPEWTPAKIYHFCAFTLWAVLLAGALCRGYRHVLPMRYVILCVLGLLVFAAIPEGLQHFNSARHPAWFDIGVNFAGGLVGLACQTVVAQHAGNPDELPGKNSIKN